MGVSLIPKNTQFVGELAKIKLRNPSVIYGFSSWSNNCFKHYIAIYKPCFAPYLLMSMRTIGAFLKDLEGECTIRGL